MGGALLGEYFFQPLDTKHNSGGSSHTMVEKTLSESPSPRNFYGEREREFGGYRSSFIIDRETSNMRSGVSFGISLYFSHIFGSQEGCEMEAGVEPKAIERICAKNPFQNGRPPTNSGIITTRGLHVQAGFEGRLFPCSSMRERPTFFLFSVERKDVSIQLSLFWSFDCPFGFYEINERNCFLLSKSQDSSGVLSRRLDFLSREQGRGREDFEICYSDIREFEIYSELRKVCSNTETTNGIPGSRDRFRENAFFCAKRKSEETQEFARKYKEVNTYFSEGNGSLSRKIECSSPIFCSNGKKISAVAELVTTKSSSRGMGLRNENFGGSKNRNRLVDSKSGGLEWEIDRSSGAIGGTVYRCLGDRLGSELPFGESKRTLELKRTKTVDQFPRTTSNFLGITVKRKPSDGESGLGSYGQYGGGSLYQSHGRTRSGNVNSGGINLGLVLQAESLSSSTPHSGKRQYRSGSAVSSGGPQRLEVTPTFFQGNSTYVGASSSGSVRVNVEHAASPILLLVKRPQSFGSGRFSARLEGNQWLRKSPIWLNRKGSAQSQDRKRKVVFGSSYMDNGFLVPRSGFNVDGSALDPAQCSRRVFTRSSRKSKAGSKSKMESSCVEGVGSFLRTGGFSTSASNFVTSAWRRSTRDRYDSHWRTWLGYCRRRRLNPITASIPEICNFLAKLFEKGFDYGTVASYRSALSSILQFFGRGRIGEDPLIHKLLKGMEFARPAKPKYADFWDVGLLLDEIRKWGQNHLLSSQRILQKAIILLRLATFGRSADMAEINLEAVQIRETHLELDFHVKKQQRSRAQSMALTVKRFEQEPNLCPVLAVLEYISRTQQWRNENNAKRLFVAVNGDHLPLSSQRIAKLVLSVMQEAGIDTKIFKAGSLRGAAASKALDNGALVEQVMRQGQWSSLSVFEKFYNRSHLLLEVLPRLANSSN
jgi:site-specific recombinase XerD